MSSSAQIIINNKELEAPPCIQYAGGTIDSIDTISYCAIPNFALCERYVGVYTVGAFSQDISPAIPKEGNTYIVLSSLPNVYWGSISTKLPCKLIKGKQYEMTFWGANCYYTNTAVEIGSKSIAIWGGADSCSKDELLWLSLQIDTGWNKYKVIFKPTVDSISNIHFRIGYFSVNSYYVALDALSDIYPSNSNDVAAQMQDTVIKPANCITLTATPSITTYDSVQWRDAAGAVISTDFTGGQVCPATSTYYVIAMRDTVPDCAGYWWSYDTVRVTVSNATGINAVEEVRFKCYPTLIDNERVVQIDSDFGGEIVISNMMGQLVSKQPFNTGHTLLDVSSIAIGGYYVYEAQLTTGQRITGKLILTSK